MAELEYFLVAENCAVDQDTDRLSAFNIIDELTLAQFPWELPQVVLIACWRITPEEIRANAQFQAVFRFSFNGRADKEFRSNFEANYRKQPVLYRLKSVPINEPGEIRIQLLLNEQVHASHSIFVDQVGTD